MNFHGKYHSIQRCDELTVWRIDRVTSWPSEELTGILWRRRYIVDCARLVIPGQYPRDVVLRNVYALCHNGLVPVILSVCTWVMSCCCKNDEDNVWKYQIKSTDESVKLITAARAGVCQPEGCCILHVFLISFFLLNESPSKRPNAVWRQIWQDVGPDWEWVVRKFQTYPSRGFSRGSEKRSKKHVVSDKIFDQNAL